MERWVVVDVETTGLDTHNDQLLAIAALGLRVDWRRRELVLVLQDSLSLYIRPETPADKRNVLLHGIGVGQQQQGLPAPDAMAIFERWLGDSGTLAFHAAFDKAMLGRYARQHLGRPLTNRWLDIEHLCEVASPETPARNLDEWLAHYHLPCLARHDAAADALAECDLLQRVWPQLAPTCQSWQDLDQLARNRRWLTRR
ncbi:MAG: hypothetical protein RJA09_862 [Pseudomonadota bacterium]|jgi:DNA polymerase-3 subunit epsilon